jgi:predicted phosphoadenosine phosphosulfate sulfurtransferase
MTGYRAVSKPDGHTWKSFASLLVMSMPDATREHYQNKILKYEKWYLDRGYPDGIPDEAPAEQEAAREAPSWRRVCKTLLRNDFWCKGIGFSPQKSTGYQKYLDLMKRKKVEWGVRSEQISLS